jgi:hypothetical protein
VRLISGRVLNHRRSCGPAIMDRKEWESVLKLSTMCGMGDIRDMAIRALATMGVDSADKILLGATYGLPSWLLSGCREIAERDETISGREIKCLEIDTVARLCQARETAIKIKTEYRIQGFWGDIQFGSEDNLRSLFAQELADAELVETLVGTPQMRPPYIDSSPSLLSTFNPVRSKLWYFENVVFRVSDHHIPAIHYVIFLTGNARSKTPCLKYREFASSIMKYSALLSPYLSLMVHL